jgi:hypothetical protein
MLTFQLPELLQKQYRPLWCATRICIVQESVRCQHGSKLLRTSDLLTTATTSPSLCFGAMSCISTKYKRTDKFQSSTAPSPELETRTHCHPKPTAAESSLGEAVNHKATCAEAQSFSSSLPSTCFFSMLSWPLSTACLNISCRMLSSKALLVDTDTPRPSSLL